MTPSAIPAELGLRTSDGKPVSVLTQTNTETFSLKNRHYAGASNGDSSVGLEDYKGKYEFAPIEEAQVSRAMIKRYESSNDVPQSFFMFYTDTLARCTSVPFRM